jgi:hypothetical protein
LTVDAGHQSKADIEEYRIGFRTLSEVYGRRGLDWQTSLRQRIKEEKFFREECASAGLKPEEIRLLTPNGVKPDSDEKDDE